MAGVGGSKPGERRGGRKAGTPNKITASLTEAIDQAFTQVGGASYLVRIAEEDPKSFCALLGKRIPKDLTMNLRLSLADLIQQSVDDQRR